MQDKIAIRPLKTLQDMLDMQEIEKIVWDTDMPLPVHQTLTAAKNGGILLGAYLGEQMIGMLYSFPGFSGKQSYLCSHTLGVLKEFRSTGIGERLKLAQAEEARKQGYDLITWTYDPLLTPNGYLNVGKLGAVCSTYIENCYGEMNDPMNQGLPTDRFQVEWWVDREKQSLAGVKEAGLIQWILNDRGLPEPKKSNLIMLDEQLATVPVPGYFQEIKEKDMGLAREWRLVTRKVFCELFNSGWAVAGFRLNRGAQVHEYLLQPRQSLALPQAPWSKGD